MESENGIFIRGFNSGYLLEQYEPALLAKVLHKLAPSTEYISGLASGQKQYQQERIEKEISELTKLRASGLDKDMERG